MPHLIAYIAVLIVFTVIDGFWLKIMGNAFYRPLLGDILAPDLRYGPAVAFYLLYPMGVVYFAARPGFRARSLMIAINNGVLFGAFAYGTYELTNYATLRNWTIEITLIDIAYGALLSGFAAAIGMTAMRLVAARRGTDD